MDNNPGDSSSESEISDPWSLVDRDSCDENSGVNSGVGSVCGELSDGESLEVIDEEDQHEVPETGVDTDGVSIITDSEINEELDQTLPAALSKEKKYLHHPNTCLNTRLNVLLALSFAAVTGLGLGHFLGLQEECPALDTSLTAQIAKLQQENEFLQHKLNQLLLERPLHFNHENIDNLEYGSEKNELELEAKELSSKQFNEHIESEPFTEFDHEKLTQVSPGAFLKILQNDIELVENDNGNILEESKENDIGNTIMVDEKESIIRDTLLEEYSFDDNKEDVIEPSDSISYLDGQILISNGKEADSYTEDLQHGLGLEEMVNDIVDIRNTYEDVEKNYINLGENIVNVNLEKNNLNEDDNVIDGNIQEVDSDSSFIIKGEENFVGTSSVDSEKIIYDLNNEDSIVSEVHVDDVNTHQQNHVHTKILDNAVNEEYTLDENNIQIIKSTLELLKLHFDKDIISIDTESILSSAVALAIEHEQNLIHLQNTITECKKRNDDFCVHFHKNLKVSASKLQETSEQLVDDIDEQMHKLLTRIVRKLNKYKNNLKNKWCHLKNKHDITNDWLESSVLLDCKKINEKEYKLKPKSPIKLSKKDNKNPKKYVEKHQIPEIIVETFSAEHLSESNAVNNDNKENLERTLHKNLQHNKYGKKDHYKKDKKKNNDKQDFRHSKPDWESKQKKQNNLETMDDEKKDNTQYVMLEHGKTWPTLNVESSKQNNISGDWIMKLADGRAEQRKLNQKNDWIFDRADARKMKRNQMKDDWYFQRAHGRKDCRHNSNSDWCNAENSDNWYHHSKHENEARLPQNNRWSKKVGRTFATAGKWMKDSFTRFQNKMNYHHH